eukprot:c10195_g1_i1.p1 GENE.c10195_g1_i1~~c10195_g1_i1.p1  ORF type:complete len:528 (+),score=180.11 c10195_g1_i1:48-1631(+)
MRSSVSHSHSHHRSSSADNDHEKNVYVADLSKDATEADLFPMFAKIGEVESIRICRDHRTNQSLGYGYVNYKHRSDAETALKRLNFITILDRQCRLMRCQKTSELGAKGNLYVSNLHPSIDDRTLFTEFSPFGDILSWKVSRNKQTGESFGTGFVRFAHEENAEAALQELNGKNIQGSEIRVEHFKPRSDETNVYVSQIPLEWDDERLAYEFSKFGDVKSAKLQRFENSTSHRGTGFVDFENEEQAAHAIREGHTIETGSDRSLSVTPFQKRNKRDQNVEVARPSTSQKLEFDHNLCINNLDKSIDTEKLTQMFSVYGEVKSAIVIKDKITNASKGYGYVSFATDDEARKAQKGTNGLKLGAKEIVVTFAENKERNSVPYIPTFIPYLKPLQLVQSHIPYIQQHQHQTHIRTSLPSQYTAVRGIDSRDSKSQRFSAYPKKPQMTSSSTVDNERYNPNDSYSHTRIIHHHHIPSSQQTHYISRQHQQYQQPHHSSPSSSSSSHSYSHASSSSSYSRSHNTDPKGYMRR